MKSRSDEEEIQPIRNLKQKYLLALKKKKNLCITQREIQLILISQG